MSLFPNPTDGETPPATAPGTPFSAGPVSNAPLRHVARDAPFYGVAYGGQALAGFLALALYTRMLGPSEYGRYSLVIATVTIVDAVGFGWINQAVLRYLPGSEMTGTHVRLLATTFYSTVGLLLVASAAWLLYTFLSRRETLRISALLGVALLSLVAMVLLNFALAIARARRRLVEYAVVTSLAALGTVAVAAGLLSFTGGRAEVIFVAGALVVGGLAVYALGRSGLRSWARLRDVSRGMLRTCASYGLPLVGASFGALALSLADRYMLQWFKGATQVGTYAAGYDLTDKSIKIVFSVLVAAALPVVMRVLSEAGQQAADRAIDDLVAVYLLAMLPLAAGFMALPDVVVTTLLGTSFSGATAVVPWVAIGTLCWGVTQILVQTFLVRERTMVLFNLLLAAAVVNIALNLWLIPTDGARGAAIATAAAYGFYLVALWFWRGRRFGVVLSWRKPAKALVAASAMYLVVRVVPFGDATSAPWALARLMLGAVVYVAIVLALGRELLTNVVAGLKRARSVGH